jgi:hypothetical protein
VDKMNECIQDCLDCYRVCLETKKYCIEKGGEHAEAEHLKSLNDCIELCKVSAHMMISGSEIHDKVCAVCAEACKRCAESCENFPDDEQMRKCAQICRKCEQSCNEMAVVKS